MLYLMEARAKEMGIRDNFQRLIEKKQDESRELEIRMRETNAYIQALQDSMRLLPKEDPKLNNISAEVTLRAGSDLARVREVLLKARIPMHVNDILEQMGKTVDQATRVGLVGTLGSYSRKGRVFTRPAPNTYGLLELEPLTAGDDLPLEFGKMEEGTEGD
jgi:hypothetical protein